MKSFSVCTVSSKNNTHPCKIKDEISFKKKMEDNKIVYTRTVFNKVKAIPTYNIYTKSNSFITGRIDARTLPHIRVIFAFSFSRNWSRGNRVCVSSPQSASARNSSIAPKHTRQQIETTLPSRKVICS